MSKILTVFGATGNQGGSVIKAVLAHPTLSSTYKIRAITRDPSTPNAQALAKQGAEVVAADMSDPDSLKKALQGSTAVFAVTNYWESASKEKEVGQGRAIADICKAANVKHLIWSALPHVTRLTNGSLKKVEHFDGKAEVAEYIESIRGSDLTATYFMPAFYMSNLLTMVQPTQGKTDHFTLGLPFGDGDSTQWPLIDVERDSGTYVAAILAAAPASVNGLYVQAVSQWVTPNEAVKALSAATGKQFGYSDLPPDVFASFLPPAIAEELKENMLLVRDYSYYGKGTEAKQAEQDRTLAITKKVTLEEWAKATGKWQ